MSSSRHQARQAALRALYLWEVGRVEPGQAIDTLFEEHEPDASASVRAFARVLVLGTASDVAGLDALISRSSEHWRVERIAIIDRLILRMAAWELQHTPETPAAVVLNEALELARRYSTDDSVRFVNGVLDSIRKSLTDPDGAATESGGAASKS